MAVKVEDVNDNDIDDSEEDDNMMTTVTRRRTCKRRRAGPEKRRTIEDVGKENGVEEGEGNDSLIAEIGVVVVVLLTILLIAVISKIKIKLLVLIIIVYNAAAVVAAIIGIVVRLSVMVDGCSNDCDDTRRWMWREILLLKNLIRETISFLVEKKRGFDKMLDKIEAIRFFGSFQSH
jgi:hypothetical protein